MYEFRALSFNFGYGMMPVLEHFILCVEWSSDYLPLVVRSGEQFPTKLRDPFTPSGMKGCVGGPGNRQSQ